MPEQPTIREAIQKLASRINEERWPEADGEERGKLAEATGLLDRADLAMKRADEYREKARA